MKHSKPRGFTLIELLVVISIIALLIAILLPMLGKAMSESKRTQCSSHLHQLIISATAYATDNKGLWPDRGQGLNDETHGNMAWHAQWHPPGSRDARKLWVGYISGYTLEDGSPFLYCPSMSPGIGYTYDEAWPDAAGNYNFGYTYLPHIPNDWRWSGTLDPPKGLEDKPGTAVWTDFTLGVAGSGWVVAPHTNTNEGFGATSLTPENNENAPAGTHSALADGSVSFDRYTRGAVIADQAELEYSIRHGSNPGTLQARPD